MKNEFKIGDVLELERQTIYNHKSQSFKITKRTIASIEYTEMYDGTCFLVVSFKENKNKFFTISHSYQYGYKVSNENSKYVIVNKVSNI